ncbi:DEAD/DEAH box helicase [Halobaculum sp. D14]|uniref:DEAD/DEAH box helicase n=1 Tax=Halobaculum sp. D14 TaxID=3421642 RepID=UPI003EBCBCEA
MRVAELPLADEYVAHFEGRGIDELYPPQADAVDAGVCDAENVVAAVPTASGKTFVAELALLTADGPGLYICPLRALAREKYEEFAALPGVDVGISTGDYDSSAAELGEHDVVVATSEKVDSAIRNGAAWVDSLACVVVDEVHLLGTEGRGPTLEVTLATLRRRIGDPQLVALSATVDNPEDIAEWLDAELVESDWRPVDLRTGVYADRAVSFDDDTELSLSVEAAATRDGRIDDDGNGGDSDSDGNADGDSGNDSDGVDDGGSGADDTGDEDVEPDDTDATAALVRDAVDGGGQALAFVRSRREAERLAERLAGEGLAAAADVEAGAAATADELRGVDGTDTAARLAAAADGGVAFHHAGLRSAHRAAVEEAFRDRRLAVICATPTLAAGVNVPARRVVVRDQQRYTGSGTEWLPVLEVHQMCGRAGRPGLDPYGEAVLVGDADTAAELYDRYVTADPEAVESKLRDRAALRTHTLSLVASGVADSQAELLDALGETFYASRTPNPDLGGVVGDVVAELIDEELLAPSRDGDGIEATELGAAISRQYVKPETGTRIVDALRTVAARDPASVTTLTAFELVCDTPDMQDTYLGERERADMYQFARRRGDELVTSMADAEDFEAWLESVKTARILAEWVDGASLADLVDAYRIGPGDLESRVERAEWLLGAADALADVVGVDLPVLAATRSKL